MTNTVELMSRIYHNLDEGAVVEAVGGFQQLSQFVSASERDATIELGWELYETARNRIQFDTFAAFSVDFARILAPTDIGAALILLREARFVLQAHGKALSQDADAADKQLQQASHNQRQTSMNLISVLSRTRELDVQQTLVQSNADLLLSSLTEYVLQTLTDEIDKPTSSIHASTLNTVYSVIHWCKRDGIDNAFASLRAVRQWESQYTLEKAQAAAQERIARAIYAVIDEPNLFTACELLTESAEAYPRHTTEFFCRNLIDAIHASKPPITVQQMHEQSILFEWFEENGTDSLEERAFDRWNNAASLEHAGSYRHAKYYLAHLMQLREATQQNRQSQEALLTLVRQDWGQFTRAYQWLRENAANNYYDALFLLRFVMNVGGEVLQLLLTPEDYRQWAEAAAEASARFDDTETLAVNLGHIGDGYAKAGYGSKAVEFYKQAIAVAESSEQPNEQHLQSWRSNMAVVNYRNTQSTDAVQIVEAQLKTTGQRNDRAQLQQQVNLVGIYFHQGTFRQAQALGLQILSIVQDTGDHILIGLLLGYLGGTYWKLGDLEQGERLCFHAIEHLKIVESQDNLQLFTDYLGQINNERGNHIVALEYHQAALDIAVQTHLRLNEGIARANIGKTYTLLKRDAEALPQVEHALAIFREIGDEVNAKITLQGLLGVYSTLGKRAAQNADYQTSQALFQRGFDLAQAENTPRQIMEFANGLGVSYDHLRQYPQAAHYYQHAYQLACHLQVDAEIVRHLYNLGQLAVKRGLPNQAISRYEDALTLARKAGLAAEQGNLLASLGMIYAAERATSKARFYFTEAQKVFARIGDQTSIQRLSSLMAVL